MDVRPPKDWKPKAPHPQPYESSQVPPLVLPPVSPVRQPAQPPVNPEPPLQKFGGAVLQSPDTQEAALPQINEPLAQSSTAQKRSRFRVIATVIGAVIALVVIAVVAGFLWWQWALAPYSDESSKRPITIENGEPLSSIATSLEEQRVIRSSLAFQWYVRLQQKTADLRAGHYRVSANQSVAEIVALLTDPAGGSYNMTILPGMTLKQLADPEVKSSFASQGFSQEEIQQAFSATYNSPLLADRPLDATLEGYIFPETYQMGTDDTLTQLLERSFDELYRRLQSGGLIEKFKARGLTLHQALILASIVQKESGKAQDQAQIAQVFLKRLSTNMALESDVTYQYAADQLGVARSVNLDSPYNTRRVPGLPPGPIATMNFSALQAIADPAPGEYLFFVAGDDGVVYFSNTLEEHNALAAKHCIELCAVD